VGGGPGNLFGMNIAGSAAVDNPFNSRRNKASTDNICKHVLVGNWVYELPYGKGRRFGPAIPAALDYLVGGWQLSSIDTFSTGTPFSVLYTSAGVGFPTSGRADLIGNPAIANPSAALWFNTAAFAAPPAFQWGTSGRNILWNPGSWNIDTAISKRFVFLERYSLQFRSEMFNSLNQPNLGGVNTSVASPTVFGKVTSFSAARVVLFGLRLAF
jgi:hypothetical protein